MKKKIIIGLIIVIVLISITFLVIYLNNRIVDDNSGFTLKDDLTAEVYSEVKPSDFINKIKGKIISEDDIKTKS